MQPRGWISAAASDRKLVSSLPSIGKRAAGSQLGAGGLCQGRTVILNGDINRSHGPELKRSGRARTQRR